MNNGTKTPSPSDPRYDIKCLCGPWTRQSRNLVVCIDGTSNQFSAKNTNVVELHSRIIKNSINPGGINVSDDDAVAANAGNQDDPEQMRSRAEQLTYYRSGIGTYVSQSYLSLSSWMQWADHTIDLAIAWNFVRMVLEAYQWITDHYRPGDRLFFFGFSRGAYQVRTIAAMIETVGLLYSGNTQLIPFAYELYKKGKPEMTDSFRKTFSRKIHVHFVGAWDTVSSIGIMRGSPLPLTTSSNHICVVRHALALDERRVKFLPECVQFPPKPSSDDAIALQDVQDSLPGRKPSRAVDAHAATIEGGGHRQGRHEQVLSDMIPGADNTQMGTKRDGREKPETSSALPHPRRLEHSTSLRSLEPVKEVWFAGSHSDIGGGNKENMTLDLGGVPLAWMENEASLAGLELLPRDWTKIKWDWEGLRNDKLTNSLTWTWWPLEYVPFNIYEFLKTITCYVPFHRHLPLLPRAATAVRKDSWVLHRGRGREITSGQRIHASLAFRDTSYQPRATFSFGGFDWKQIIGIGETEQLSWARGLEPFLEMGVFDMTFALNRVVAELEETKNVHENLGHLYFITISADGAAAVSRNRIVNKLVDFLSSENTGWQARAVDCLAQLAKFEHEYLSDMPLIIEPLILRLGAMIRCANHEIVLGSVHCLAQFCEVADSTGSIEVLPAVRKIFNDLDEASIANLQSVYQTCISNLGNQGSSPQYLLCLSRLALDDKIRRIIVNIAGSVVSKLLELLINCINDATKPVYRTWADSCRLIRDLIFRRDSSQHAANSQSVNPAISKDLIITSLSEWMHDDEINESLCKEHMTDTLNALPYILADESNPSPHGAATFICYLWSRTDGAEHIIKCGIVQKLIRQHTQTVYHRLKYLSSNYEGLRDHFLEAGIFEQMAEMLKSKDDEVFKAGADYLHEYVYDENSAEKVVNTDSVATLIAALSSPGSARRDNSMRCLYRLFQRDQKSLRDHIIGAGIFEQMAEMLKSKDDEIFEAGTDYLHDFVYDENSAEKVVNTDSVATLIAALSSPELVRRYNSMRCLYRLFQRDQKNLRDHILEAGIFEQMAEMLKSKDDEIFEAGTDYLHRLVYDENCAEKVVKTDGVATLIAALSSPVSARWDKSLYCLYCLFQRNQKSLRDHIIGAGISEQIAEMLKSKDDEIFKAGTEYLSQFIYDENSAEKVVHTDGVATLIAALSPPVSARRNESLSCLMDLFRRNKKSLRDHILEAGIFEQIAEMLKSKDDEVFKAGTEYLYEFVYDENSAEKVVNTDSVATLIAALSSPELVRRYNSMRCLYRLFQRDQKSLRDHIVGAGIIERVAEMLKSKDYWVFQAGTEYLWKFVDDEDSAQRVMQTSAVATLIAELVEHTKFVRLFEILQCLAGLARHASIGRFMLSSNGSNILKLLAVLMEREWVVCSYAVNVLANLAAHDDAGDHLETLDIPKLVSLLQHTDARIRFSVGPPHLWIEFGKHANLRAMMLKEKFMTKVLGLIQNDPDLDVREQYAVTFCDLLQYDDLRLDALRAEVASVQILTNLVENSDKPVSCLDFSSPWDEMSNLSGRYRIADAAATALRGFGSYENAMDDILQAGSIEAVTSRLLSPGDRERWDLQYSGAVFIGGCAKHARGREAILRTNAIRALGELGRVEVAEYLSDQYETLKRAAMDALQELANYDDTKAEAMQELENFRVNCGQLKA